MKKRLIGPFSQLITMEDCPAKGPIPDESIRRIQDGGILIDGDAISEIGPFATLAKTANEVHEIEGTQVAIPGLIDAHTHLCFAGSRAKDYAARNSGKSYLQIAKEGGGIWDTVTQTRRATEPELTDGIVQRANRHVTEGATTIEVKSGYGLSVAEEVKMLRAIAVADKQLPCDLVPTCLAAHVLPKDFDGNHLEYLNHMAEELFPLIHDQKLTNRIDAFVEEEAFDSTSVQAYFSRAQRLGFSLTVHADQFSPGGSKLAVDMNALSADHLEASTEKEIEYLANSDTVAIALPGASIGLGMPFTPARKLLDHGASLAIASDWNPGSAPMGDLLMQASLLGAYEKLSNMEVLAGLTSRAARGLGLDDRGKLAPGKLADLITFQTDDVREVFYHQGKMKPSMVFKRGKMIHSN